MCDVEISPSLYYRENLTWGHVGQSEIVRWRETDNIALSSHSFCAEKSGGERSVLVVGVVVLLVLHDGTIVIDEDICVLELWIVFAICPRVCRT